MRSIVHRSAAALGLVLGAALLAPIAPAHAQVFVDDTPGPAWRVDGTVYATKIVGDTVFVGGQFSNAVSPTGVTLPRKNLAAFSVETGSPLTTWRADAASIVRVLESDGESLYVGGSFQTIGGVARSRLAKLSVVTGGVDPSFAPTFDNTVRALAVDGLHLFVGGAFATANGSARSRVAKLDAVTGTLDPLWAPSVNNTVYGLAADTLQRRLYVAGNFTSVAGVSRTGVARLDADTAAVASTVFASAARPTLGLDLSPDGSQLFGAGGGSTNAAVAWNPVSGTRTWRQTANGDIQSVQYFAGDVFFGFHDGYQGDTALKLLAADAQTGVIDPDFRPQFDQFWGVWSMDVSDEALVVGGDFTTVSGVPARGLAVFKRTNDLPPPPPVTYNYADATTSWKYWDQGTRPADWEGVSFNDSAWPAGLTQLGYGDGDEQTVIGYGPSSSNKYRAYYFRTVVDAPEVGDTVTLLMAADDGAVVYVNGVEAVRDNMPAGTITNTTHASSERSGGAENELRSFALDPALFQPGPNTVAVEVHQVNGTSGDVSFDADIVATVASPPNGPPTAAFTSTVNGLQVDFDASSSSDPEGPVAAYSWNFGDGTTATGPAASHTYATEGTYTVTLRVTDQDGISDTVVQNVEPVGPTVDTVVVADNASWSWRYVSTAPPSNWKTSSYDASTWAVGGAVLGFGGSVTTNIDTFATTSERPITAYFRRTFEVTNLASVQGLQLRTVANDGVVVYVNGVEVGRSNMPTGTIGHATYALSSPSTSTANNSPYIIDVPTSLLVEGTNLVTAETHVKYRGTPDVSFNLRATLSALR